MPKVNDIKAYTQDVFKKAGLGDDVLKQVLATFDDEKTLKAFTDNFKPLPDYSHDLDDVRNKAKADKDQEYKDWFDKEQQKYNEYLQGLDELQRLRQTNGPGKPSGEGTGMTKEEIDKLVSAQLQTALTDTLSRRDAAVLDLLEVREFHMDRFKKPLDTKAFESAWKEHPEWGGQLKQAYKNFVEPDVKKAEEAEWTKKLDEKYQEGIRDGFTRKQIPTDHQPKTFSPFWDRKEDVAKMAESDQEKHSREAFFNGLRESDKQTA